MALNCGTRLQLRPQYCDAVISVTTSHLNCGVIFIHVYDRNVTALGAHQTILTVFVQILSPKYKIYEPRIFIYIKSNKKKLLLTISQTVYFKHHSISTFCNSRIMHRKPQGPQS
jgi:hypothetical protein